MKKSLIILIFISLLFLNSSFGVEDMMHESELFDLDRNYSAGEIYQVARLLEMKYPNIIKIIDLGESLDNKKIFTLVMSTDIQKTLLSRDGYVDKMHFLVEAGTHGRENAGPNVLMKSIESYAMDYYHDNTITEFNVRKLLNENVIHFIPLVNPDGYNLTTQGMNSISYDYRVQLRSFRDWNFSNYKANLNGVDINRNYPGYYYDVEIGMWRDIWNMIHNENRSFIPSGAFYFGPFGGSEIETQIMMKYLLKYDFRNYLSYHNKGEVIYWDKWMLSKQHNKRAEVLSLKASTLTGYQIIDSSRYTSSSGYMADFISMNTLKPAITLELINWRVTLPADVKYFSDSYEKTKLVPLIFVEDGQMTGYFNYRWYKDGVYVRDFEELIYAEVFAEEYGGTIIEDTGKPRFFLDEQKNHLTRIEVVKSVMEKIDYNLNEVLYEFDDCSDLEILKARALGITSGYQNRFRPDDYVTYDEFYVILHKSFYQDYELENIINTNIKNNWAVESFLILVENEVLDYLDLRMGKITLGDLNTLLENCIK